MKFIGTVLAFLLFCATSQAQDATTPAPTSGVAQRILVIGDALAGGLGAGLSRMTEAAPQYDVTFRVNESSGLARPEIYDWSATVPNLLEGDAYDIVIVMAGTNDRRDILLNGQNLTFGTPEWSKAYGENTAHLIDAIIASGATLYWAGLPPMGDADYDAAMRTITALHKTQTEAKKGTFIDLYTPLLGPDAKYSDMGSDETGTFRKLRSRDGVNFYKQGNNRMAQLVLGALSAGQADKAFDTAQQPETPQQVMPSTPVFGMAGENGAEIIFESTKLAEAMQNGQTEAEAVKPATPAVKLSIAQPGTAADRLYTTGLSDPAPQGRLDDYTVEAPAN
jgi:hypothetical protein